VVLGQRDDEGWRLDVIERTHDRYGASTGQRQVNLLRWPQPGQRPAIS
jgi:hypothetical protein